MKTTIIIEHESVQALKSSPLWAQIMTLFLVDGNVRVVEITRDDDGRKGK